MAFTQIENAFTFHPSSPEQVEKYKKIRDVARGFAHFLDEELPASEEKREAIRFLDYAVMRANAAIARHS